MGPSESGIKYCPCGCGGTPKKGATYATRHCFRHKRTRGQATTIAGKKRAMAHLNPETTPGESWWVGQTERAFYDEVHARYPETPDVPIDPST